MPVMAKTNDRNSQVLSSMFNLRSDMASCDEIENTIVSGAKLQGTNAWILMMAILVASVGLNTNSTAVIIGAMLISPLMGSIIAIAYGIATNNLTLARFSAVRLTIQMLISIATSFVYFSISPINAPSGELLARTSPTIYDVLIAVSGGFAGIIGQTRKEKSNVIPGVAIATALMPPLCTAGYGLAHKNLAFFSGALYLFFINGFFICVTAVIVLKYLRVPQFKELDKKQLTKIHRSIAVIAVITMIPSIYFAYHQIKDTIENSSAEAFIKNEFVFDGTQVVQKTVDINDKVIEISLIGKEITPARQEELEEKLTDYKLENYSLKINQTAVKDGITADEVKALLAEYDNDEEEPNVDEILTIKENEELSAENEQLKTEIEELHKQLDESAASKIDVAQISAELTAISPKISGAAAAESEIYISPDENGSRTIVTLFVTKELDNNEFSAISAWLRTRLGKNEITVLQQDLSAFRGEESSAAARSTKEDSSKPSTADSAADSKAE